MPMYFPDLKSVQTIAKQMRNNTPGKEYKGIIPKNESELSEARKQLGKYFRDVWKDKVQAMEIEEAVSQNDYNEKLSARIISDFQTNYET